MLSFVRMITDPAIIQTAILGVASIFSMMFLLGLFLLVTGVKFGFGVGFFLWFILLLFIIAQMVFMALNKYQVHVKLFSIFGILLFSIYILYDTNRILQKDYLGDFITASMDYYLDIINLFLDLVNYQNS
jgi:FtsH-binding integral membrane protein